MKKLTITVLWLALTSCHAPPASDRPHQQQRELLVAAAANLTDAFAQLGQHFTSKTGIRVVFSFGATADLSKQIENGAPFDVFAAADIDHLESLDRAGLIMPGTKAVYARGRLVLWLPPGSPLKLQRIEDITGKEFDRIAIAKPDVAPYGDAAVESLRRLKLWDQIERKVVYAQNVSQAKQYAATGNAEAAFIPLSLVKANEGTYVEVDENLHVPIYQSLGAIKSSGKQDAARDFVNFVLSEEGQELLISKGYSRPAVK